MKKRQHTFTVVISAPAGLTRRQVRREVRTLINEQTNWGETYAVVRGYGERDFLVIEERDIKVRSIA